VPVKTADQQASLCVHRIRQGVIAERTALINQLRGLLMEFGFVIPKGRYPAQKQIPLILEDAENGLPMLARHMIQNLWQKIKQANEEILFYDRELSKQARHNPNAKRLMTIPGVGEQVATYT
jgi:transposase